MNINYKKQLARLLLMVGLIGPVYAQNADSVASPITSRLGIGGSGSNTINLGTNAQCRTPFGTVIGPGQSIIAYNLLESTLATPCRSEVRTCNNSVLSGSYQYQMCTVIEPPEPPTPPLPLVLAKIVYLDFYKASSTTYTLTFANAAATEGKLSPTIQGQWGRCGGFPYLESQQRAPYTMRVENGVMVSYMNRQQFNDFIFYLWECRDLGS